MYVLLFLKVYNLKDIYFFTFVVSQIQHFLN